MFSHVTMVLLMSLLALSALVCEQIQIELLHPSSRAERRATCEKSSYLLLSYAHYWSMER